MTPPAVILSHTQMGENVGSAARAMKNFGLTDLRLIAPKMEWPNDRAQILASGAGDILDRAQIHADAPGALADCQLVLATTARGRDVTREVLTAQAAAQRLRQAADAGVKTAILFGGERAGLDNDEISLCDALITIPTAPLFIFSAYVPLLVVVMPWKYAMRCGKERPAGAGQVGEHAAAAASAGGRKEE